MEDWTVGWKTGFTMLFKLHTFNLGKSTQMVLFFKGNSSLGTHENTMGYVCVLASYLSVQGEFPPSPE